MPETCDYEGSDYKQRFWTRDRLYEDLVERQALRALLPETGHAIADCGAGFGRLADLYAGYERIVLLDYSRTMLQQARDRYRGDPRFLFVATDIRKLPLATNSLDAIVTVRVLHHLRSVTQAVEEAARVLAPGGYYLLEFASKRHVKAIARYLLAASPGAPSPSIRSSSRNSTSTFTPATSPPNSLKPAWSSIAAVPSPSSAGSHSRTASPPSAWPASRPLSNPSPPPTLSARAALLRARADKHGETRTEQLLACPHCHGPLTLTRHSASCTACRRAWPCANGIYDFKGESRSL